MYSEIISIYHSGSLNCHEYRLHGALHRLDGPAVEYDSGIKVWYVHGVRAKRLAQDFWYPLYEDKFRNALILTNHMRLKHVNK